MSVEFKKIIDKNHRCALQSAEPQPKLISLDYNNTKKYNYSDDFKSEHKITSFQGQVYATGVSLWQTPTTITPHSPKSLFYPFNKNPKHHKESLTLQRYAKSFYAQIKQEQTSLLQSHLNLNLPLKASL